MSKPHAATWCDSRFIRAQAPDTFNGQPVNFGTTFLSTVTAQDASGTDPSLLPGFDLQIRGAPTSRPAADPQAAWGGQYGEESDYVRTFVQRIRRKIEPDRSRPRYLFTEAGVG